ncbi:hypothetical protein ACW9I6_12215 [Pseudomonas sp. SDO5522_S412]
MFNLRLQPPESGEAFDKLVNKLSPNFLRVTDRPWVYGRSGQAQFGVDHYHQESGKAVQSKNLQSMTYAVVLEELAKTQKFEHVITQYYIVCSTPTDRALQDKVIELNNERRAVGLFPVELVFWDQLTDIMNADPGLREDYTGIPGISAQVASFGQTLQSRPLGSASEAKALITQCLPAEKFLIFLFYYDFSTARVPSDAFEAVQHVTQKLQDVQLYKNLESKLPNDQAVQEFRSREWAWWEAWEWLAPLLPHLQGFYESIRSQTSWIETEEGAFMAIYSAHQPFHSSMKQQTAQWRTTAHALAHFFFDHFYDGDMGFPPFVLAKFKPRFSW